MFDHRPVTEKVNKKKILNKINWNIFLINFNLFCTIDFRFKSICYITAKTEVQVGIQSISKQAAQLFGFFVLLFFLHMRKVILVYS